VNVPIEDKGFPLHGLFSTNFSKIACTFRNGNATREDIATINTRVEASQTLLPEDICYGTFCNKDHDSINAVLFHKYCQDDENYFENSIIILADKVAQKNSANIWEEDRVPCWFWEGCSKSDCDFKGNSCRLDPCLKLYKGIRLMLPINEAVLEGKANETQMTLDKVVLKYG
jgi:hypothetical protein